MQWFYDLKTIQKMFLLIFCMVVSMLALSFTGYYFNQQANDGMSEMYANRLLPIRWINIIRSNANGIRADILDLMMATNKDRIDQDLNNIKKRKVENNKLMAEYEKTKLDDFEKEKIQKYKELLQAYRDVQGESIDFAINGKGAEGYAYFVQHEQVISDVQQILRDLANHNAQSANKISLNNKKNAQQSTIIIVIVSIFSLLLCASLGYITAKRIQNVLAVISEKMNFVADGDLTIAKAERQENSDLGDLCIVFNVMLNNLQKLVAQVAKSAEEVSANSEELNMSADQTAQGSQQVAQSVTQLAAGSQQVANSVTQLAMGANEVSKNVEASAANLNKINEAIQKVSTESVNVAKLGNDTEVNATQGKSLVLKAVEKIGSIKKVSGEVSSTIGELGVLSSEIEQIVDLIKNISGQTNLLALNAAIEAARAGEHGKGFAVVADEVKKLASQSGEATDKITGMIKIIQQKTGVAVSTMEKASTEVEEGVLVVNDTGNALESIIDQVKAANVKIQDITKEIDDIAISSDNVVKMIENVSTITEQTAASAGEISSVTQQTSASAEEIASITEEQTASLKEISSSSQTLAEIAETLALQVATFKL